MRLLKQSTSVDLPIGPFLDDTDGKTAETALTLTQPDIRLKKNGGAWAQKNAAQTLSHEENGNYEVTLDATDTDTLGHLRVHVHESGALPVWEDFLVVPANVYDSLVAGSDNLEVDTIQAAGTAWASGAITAASIATGAIDADALAADAVDEILDEVVEGSTTLRQMLRGFAAALIGKADGLAGTTVHYRDLADSKNRITATVDADGNRIAITLDLT